MTVKRDRDLLLRYYVHEEEKPEICRALGLDSLHFNRVLYRAKQRFREILERSGDPQLTLELNRYNLEYNLSPYAINETPFKRTEQEIHTKLAEVRAIGGGLTSYTKVMLAKSAITQVAGACPTPPTVPGLTTWVTSPAQFRCSAISTSWLWPQQTRSQSPVAAIAWA